ncbi:high mobility group B 14 [Olea europaea subsp. europaea]|uniref:High mobility group B 14 n=1 Tax=Olea europaea subsp. europaea TaxID=158383 RepID=A0A8S0RUY4_OLEEU|nr:high mobility group B 14 [Olea europaea subsp. europaea]CAA3026528.1 high mobility group B 14 [Olea europaea subsp. europaea]
MARRRTSRSRNSSSTSASTESPKEQTDGKMALRVTTSEKTKKSRKKPKTLVSKKQAAKINAMKPKKPPTAFFYYLEDFRKEYQEQNPDVKSMRDVGKACGEKWKTMTYEEKVQYYDIATEKRAEFDRAIAEFEKRKETGDFDELKDDSDFDE